MCVGVRGCAWVCGGCVECEVCVRVRAGACAFAHVWAPREPHVCACACAWRVVSVVCVVCVVYRARVGVRCGRECAWVCGGVSGMRGCAWCA